ncbi:TPA: lysogeny establishment protein [Escherichia coli]|nr:lysogeny establishment protein [Escherichia coli]HAP0063015.1 lysogeny establishment protein [Escherichia coli]
MRKDFNIDGKYVVLSVSTNIQSPAVIVTVKLSDRMPDIDSISVAFPVKSMRGAEHFVMNATEEEARRGFAKEMSEFGEFLGHVDKALSISSARSKALTASMMK